MIAPAEFRGQFSVFEHTIYCASCSQGALSKTVQTAIGDFVQGWDEQGARWDVWIESLESARRRFAALMHARPEDIAVLPSASEAVFQVVSSLGLTSDAAILSSRLEFPSIAQVLVNAAGPRVKFVDQDGLSLTVDDYTGKLLNGAKLVSVPLVSYKNGFRPPVEDIAERAHRHGAAVLVDAYQGAGAVAVNVTEMGCDFLVAGSLKYLLGTGGVAFVYVHPHWHERLQPVMTGWFGRVNPYAFDPPTVDFPPTARRLETGTPAVLSARVADAALSLLAQLDAKRVESYVAGLVSALQSVVEDQGLQWVGHGTGKGTWGPMAAVQTSDPAGLDAYLRSRGIAGSPRGQAFRLSFHYYNTQADVLHIADALKDWSRDRRR